MESPLPFHGRFFWHLSDFAAQPSAQITLALTTAALLYHLELFDAIRDARALRATFSIDPSATLARLQQGQSTTEVGQERRTAGVTMKMDSDEVVPLALLAQLAFFASGYQATPVSWQWKAKAAFKFVLTSKLSSALSPVRNPQYNSAQRHSLRSPRRSSESGTSHR
jgi:hypothetical protein